MKLVIGDIGEMRIRVHFEGETIEDDLYITLERKNFGMMVFYYSRESNEDTIKDGIVEERLTSTILPLGNWADSIWICCNWSMRSCVIKVAVPA
jgi:hypothetical protein